MPIDPVSGLYSYGEPSFQPGGSSPALGGLVSLLNAIQGQQARQKNVMQDYTKNAMTGEYDTAPGQAILRGANISPEDQAALQAALPQNRLRKAFTDIQATKEPGERMTNDEILSAYTNAGLPAPNGLFGYMGRQVSAEAGAQKGIAQNIERMYDRLAAQAVPEDQIWGRVSQYVKSVVPDPAKQEVYLNNIMAAKGASGTSATPKSEAQKNLIESQGNLANERTTVLDEMLAPNKAKAYAQAGLANAHAELAKVATRIKEAEATGVPVTSDEKARLITALNTTEKNLGEAAGGGALKSTLGGPAGQAANRAAVKELQDTVKTLKSMLGEGATANKHFASEKEAIDAYKADHNGQAPSAAVIANMKAKGWF